MKESVEGVAVGAAINESWDSVRYFIALMRHGSLNAASRQLVVDHTTVRRRLRDLATRVGVTLFDRRPGGMTLTPAARDAAEDAAHVEMLMTDLLRRLKDADQRVEGEVRMTTTHGIGMYWLIARL